MKKRRKTKPDRNSTSADVKNAKNRFNGTITEALPNTIFRATLEDGRKVLVYLSGKMRMHRIRVVTGDNVLIEMSPYDEKRGRIVYRGKAGS